MRAYHWLLRLCPAALREEYGDEMAATFARQLAGRDRCGPGCRSWLAGLGDVVATAARAHADMARAGPARCACAPAAAIAATPPRSWR